MVPATAHPLEQPTMQRKASPADTGIRGERQIRQVADQEAVGRRARDPQLAAGGGAPGQEAFLGLGGGNGRELPDGGVAARLEDVRDGHRLPGEGERCPQREL
jgi:hypothetical protein